MTLTPMEHYFIIKIDSEKQKKRKDKVGNFYIHASYTFMQRNMQQGEIVAIGSIVATQFPQAKVGDTLIFHHFVEGSERGGGNFIFEENGDNYYYVTAADYNGHRCECFGLHRDGVGIIPHPDFVFIEQEKKVEGDVDLKELEEEIGFTPKEQMTKTESGLLLFTNWTESREEKELKATILLNEIKQGSKGKSISDSSKRGFEEKQIEAAKITASLNKPKYVPYTLLFFNPVLQKSYNTTLSNGDRIYCMNQGAQMEIEFNGKTYIVANTKYVAAIEKVID